MKVEVDIADLETLVFATGAIKSIEAALQHRLDDPFVKPHLDFTEANNRLAEAMRHARRTALRTAINWDEPLTKEEIEFLESLSFREAGLMTISGERRLREPEIDSLMSKGCIRMGQDVIGTIWPGESKPDLKPVPSYSIQITARGRYKLDASLHPKTLELPLAVEGVKQA